MRVEEGEINIRYELMMLLLVDYESIMEDLHAKVETKTGQQGEK